MTCLGRLLTNHIEHHLKLLPSRHRFTCDITQDRPICSDYAHIIGTERLGTNFSIIIFFTIKISKLVDTCSIKLFAALMTTNLN